jgi:hypothetical protein
MNTSLTLEEGDEILCPHCRRWHPVSAPRTQGTAYTQAMLYWRCTKGKFYAGQRGLPSRHQTRKPQKAGMSS